MTEKTTILVTGSGGLFAPYVISEAVKLGYNVVTTSRHSSKFTCDLTDFESTKN